MILLLLAFVAGALTALAPCVLPLLPIIIGGALAGNEREKYRPYLIAGSLASSLILFTYLLKVSSLFIGISPKLWVYLSSTLVIGVGLVTLFPSAWENFVGRIGLQARSDRLLKKGAYRSGWVGAVVTGVALGPVFSSCSPTYAFILATVLPKNFATGFIYLISYSLGLVAVLLLITIRGRKALIKYSWAVDPHSLVRRSVGALFIIIGLAIGFGYDKKAELWVTSHLPFNITSLDQSLLTTVKTPGQNPTGLGVENVNPYLAPELTGVNSWINSSPLTIKSLHGKVVMVDFWTYSCINCVRTLPYLEKWYEAYKSKGFVIIGVHAPEFGFEKVLKNVQQATRQYGLTYPIALDNNLSTWNAFANQYWPAHYIINRQGKVVNVHYGEGEYAKTEKVIQTLLGESAPLVSQKEVNTFNRTQTPETYFGSMREDRFAGSQPITDGTHTYQIKKYLPQDYWSIGGAWDVTGDHITSQSSISKMKFLVRAKDVYLVASVPDSLGHLVEVSLPNQPGSYTTDDAGGKLNIMGSNLYHLASFPKFGEYLIELTVSKSISLHTFTFGG